jgi:hypothetical protein
MGQTIDIVEFAFRLGNLALQLRCFFRCQALLVLFMALAGMGGLRWAPS